MTKAERAEELRAKADELKKAAEAAELAAHIEERMKEADTIPTCPSCGGREFNISTFTTVSQSISYEDDEDCGDWQDDYESGDHTELNESASCVECGEDARTVLEAHHWTFYDNPRPRKQQIRIEKALAIAYALLLDRQDREETNDEEAQEIAKVRTVCKVLGLVDDHNWQLTDKAKELLEQ